MKIHQTKPNPIFSDYINCYWEIESESMELVPTQLVYPEATTELMFHFGRPFLSEYEGLASQQQPLTAFCPQKTVSAHVIPGPTVSTFSVNFTPVGAALFFNLPFAELRNQIIDAASFLGASVVDIAEQLGNASGFMSRTRIIEAFLQQLFNEKKADELRPILETLSSIGKGKLFWSVEDIADMACVSFRTLDRMFARYIGLTPKEYIKIERMKYAIALMHARSQANLTSIAHSAGYYDQSHFNKDFRRMTGTKPRSFRELLLNDCSDSDNQKVL